MTQRCRYCGMEMRRNVGGHEDSCPHNPDIAPRLREMMHEYSDDGVYAMPSVMYAEWVVGTGLPALTTIRNVFGSYAAFCVWCGLKPPLSRWAKPVHANPETMPGSIMADDFRWHDPSVLRCEPARIPVRAWDPHEKRYVEIGVQGVWRVR